MAGVLGAWESPYQLLLLAFSEISPNVAFENEIVPSFEGFSPTAAFKFIIWFISQTVQFKTDARFTAFD